MDNKINVLVWTKQEKNTDPLVEQTIRCLKENLAKHYAVQTVS
jgi:hypothetical protein